MVKRSLAERPEVAPLSLQELQKFIVPQPDNVDDAQYARDTEVFMRFCSSEDFNPIGNDIYLIYRNTNIGSRDRPNWVGKASIQVGIGGYLKRAAQNPNYNGFKSGVVVEGGKRYPGTLVLEGEAVIGAWAKIYRKDRIPTEVVVSMKEYGQTQAVWRDKPDTMIEKTAIVQGLRRTFPDQFEGLKEASAEVSVDVGGDGPPEAITVPQGELTTERTQQAFHGTDPDWKGKPGEMLDKVAQENAAVKVTESWTPEGDEIVVDGKTVVPDTGEITGDADSGAVIDPAAAEHRQEAAKDAEFDGLGNPSEVPATQGAVTNAPKPEPAKFTVPAKLEDEEEFLKIIESFGRGDIGSVINGALGVGVDAWVKGHKATHREALIECLEKWGDVEFMLE